METKEEDGHVTEEWQTSPIQVIEEAVRVAGEALHNVYSPSSNLPPPSQGPGHRRSRSEIVTSLHKRNNSFQQWKSQMRRALRLGTNLREQSCSSSFNPEILADQKRQWYRIHSKTSDYQRYYEPTSLFEHFIIAGLHPDANLEVVEDSFARTKKLELEMDKSEIINFRMLQRRGPSLPSMDPQILFRYPPGKRLDMRLKDLAAFCFPSGVKARVLQRTPSLTELNQLVYGQGHLSRDDLSFIFSLKAADNATLYGVCLHVHEIVQKPPAIYGSSSPLSQLSVGCSRFLVAAPRCYCVLTRVPFFELHYEMLNSIIAQERLNRITQFVSEMTMAPLPPLASKSSDMEDNTDSQCRESVGDWTASAIPVDCTIALAAAAAGIISDDEVPSSSSRWEPCSPECFTASEASDHSQAREVDKGGRNHQHHVDDCSSEASENRTDFVDKMYRNYENGQTPDIGTSSCTRNRNLERLGSSESLFSSVRSVTSEDEDDDVLFANERDVRDDVVMLWAKENKSDLLQIVSSYHSRPLPQRGSEIVFQPLEHLQAIEYRRLSVSALGISEKQLDLKTQDPKEAAKVNLKLAVAEEAAALSIWTTATICRVLSLENVLTLITGVLLEKQVVVVCPNLGVLSAVVLSVIPIIRPFEWQSLFLPILPEKMLDFLDAPVPFIVGLQHKTASLKMKTSNLVQVNLVKDQVKTCYLPHLPRHKELISQLEPIYARLSSEYYIAQRHPVYRCNEVQAAAASQFLVVVRQYLESLCSDLRLHTITSVQSNNDRVSILLKESFVGSFHSRDQPFVQTPAYQVMSISATKCVTSYNPFKEAQLMNPDQRLLQSFRTSLVLTLDNVNPDLWDFDV